MTGATHYAPYRRADATQDIYIVVGFCMLMFLSGMVVALMLIAEYQEYLRRTNRTSVTKRSAERVLMPASPRGITLRDQGFRPQIRRRIQQPSPKVHHPTRSPL
ncbi:uncharacterized protein LOC144097469 [Amblyomma americanum]